MAKLVKKSTEEETVDTVIENGDENINNSELDILQSNEETSKNTIHTDKLEKALKVVQDRFNLDEFNILGFKDSGNKIELSLSNSDFEIAIKVKDCEAYSIF